MGLKREYRDRDERRPAGPARGKALLDYALAVTVTAATGVTVRLLSGSGVAFYYVWPCAFLVAALVLAAYRHGVTPRSYWRNRRDPAWPPRSRQIPHTGEGNT